MGRIIKWFGAWTGSIGGAAALLGLASLLSRLAGLLRDRLLSSTFGAGAELDAYYAAFRYPDLMHALLVGGAVTAGFIPVFARYEHGQQGFEVKAERLASTLIVTLGAALSVAALLGMAFAGRLAPLIAPGFGPEGQALAAQLTRVIVLSPLFLGLSGVFGGILQAKRRFLAFSFAPILYNLGIIFGTVFLAPEYGILGPANGVVLGAAAHCAVQVAACARAGFTFRPSFDLRSADVVEVARLTVPRVAGLAVANLNLILLTGLASTLGTGSVAVFTLANNLQYLPIGIIGVSFAVAAFPVIAELAAHGKREAFIAQFSRTVRTVLFLIVPATVAILLLRAQIVRVVLGAGRFDWADTIATADTLAWFAFSLFAQALLPLVLRASFAFHDTVTPLVAGVVGVALERLLASIFVRAGLGVPGLALASSIGIIVTVVISWVVLRHRVGALDEKVIMRSLARISAAAIAMAVVVQAAKIVIAGLVDMQSFAGIATQGAVAAALGLVVYVVVAHRLGSDEARQVVALYRRKVSPVPVTTVAQEGEGIHGE